MKSKAIIETVCAPENLNEPIPIKLKFQNGELAAINKHTTQLSRILHSKNNTKGAMVVVRDQVYHGLMDANETNALTDSYICIRNKATNKVRIVPIEQINVNNNVYKELEKETQLQRFSKESTIETLLSKFSGRKMARYLDNRDKMKMNMDEVKKNMEKTVAETSITEESVKTQDATSHYNRLRPETNNDAKNLDEVYNATTVVPAELLERLEEEAKVVYATDCAKLPITSEYLRNCLQKIQNATQSQESFLKVKLIIYMDCLLNLIRSSSRSLKKTNLSNITEKVENDVRTRFSDPYSKSCSRTLFTTEKALCYFIVLALLINNYEVDVNILCQELKSSRQKVIKYAQIIYARVEPRTDNLKLRLPSTMPLETKNRKSKNNTL